MSHACLTFVLRKSVHCRLFMIVKVTIELISERLPLLTYSSFRCKIILKKKNLHFSKKNRHFRVSKNEITALERLSLAFKEYLMWLMLWHLKVNSVVFLT